MIRSITRSCCIIVFCTAPLSHIAAAPFTIAVIGDQQVPVSTAGSLPASTDYLSDPFNGALKRPR